MSEPIPPPNPQRPQAFPPDPAARQATVPQEPEEMNLGEWIANFWEGRYIILGAVVLFLALGIFVVWKSVPVYQMEAMIQIQAKKERSTDPALTKMENLFSEPSDASAEIEIIKSNLIMGRVVEALALDISVSPKLFPVFGAPLARRRPGFPRLEVADFEIAPNMRGKRFTVIAEGGGALSWKAPDGTLLAKGRIGEWLAGTYDDAKVRLRVRTVIGKPGQEFALSRVPMQAAISSVRLNFDAFEKGKNTNVLGLIFKSTNIAQGSMILNEIMNQYVRHKVEKKGGEAAQALALLQAKMPVLKASLEDAESRLNGFRSQSGSVDLNREADFVLQQSAALAAQITGLHQKKQELLRTYKENADVVTTVNEQIRKLQTEQTQVDGRARALPSTQQTVLRLTRDVQVTQELYTALLNNIQQLQIAAAGDVGSYDLVDKATTPTDPIGPSGYMRVAVFGFLGLLVGAGTARLRRVLRRGIKDHRIIEAKLGLPVIVTIPHSKAQDDHALAMRRRDEGLHLLAVITPDDLATESLRSLRTVLHFSARATESNIVMITGPSPSIGKSFISSNFSAVLAQAGAKVLLIDGDLRKGNVHRYFGLKTRNSGLSDVLAKRATWESVVRETEVVGLDIITTGIIPPNPSELLMSERFTELLKAVAETYQYVIIDAPPLLAVTDAAIIGSRVGTVLLVAKYGQHPLDEVRASMLQMEGAGVTMLGCIFNDIMPTGLGAIGGNYQYSYHYTYKG